MNLLTHLFDWLGREKHNQIVDSLKTLDVYIESEQNRFQEEIDELWRELNAIKEESK